MRISRNFQVLARILFAVNRATELELNQVQKRTEGQNQNWTIIQIILKSFTFPFRQWHVFVLNWEIFLYRSTKTYATIDSEYKQFRDEGNAQRRVILNLFILRLLNVP